MATVAFEKRPALAAGTLIRWIGLGLALALGVGLRLAFWPDGTGDTELFLKPWYAFAHDHGWRALGTGFTNYTPFYSYLLIAISRLDGVAPPLLLIKTISFVFELATALLAYRFVARATGDRNRAVLALAALWLAPGVLYNGARWGQADSIWTFFILLSVYLYAQNRNGVVAFATATAVKAQAVFLGPFALGMMLRQRRNLLWFAALPIVYLALAIPPLALGRPLMDILQVYAAQAEYFHRLSMNAASIWALAWGVPYEIGVPLGLVMAALAGIGITALIARSKRCDIEFFTLAAALSLLAMPLLLPKMHDRYFYAFEVVSIVLAGLNPRYLMVAMAAQTSAVLSYMAFDRGVYLGVIIAAIQNLILAAYLVRALVTPAAPAQPKPAELVAYGLLSLATPGLLPFCRDAQANSPVVIAVLILSAALFAILGLHCMNLSRRLPAEA
jgi:Gpi18-like mannosyltransferase